MDEAEALCDRLGIFVAGRLKTVGHASELKERYGRFYKIQITTNTGADSQILAMLQDLSPKVRLLNSLAGTNNFEAPSDDIQLDKLFDTIETNKKIYGITHWGVSNTTLEEIFLKVTQDEVQDEALKFARKSQKSSRCGCCFSSKTHEEPDPAHDIEDLTPAVPVISEGEAGFFSDPVASLKRLDLAVNELDNDEDDDDFDDEIQSSSTSTESDTSESDWNRILRWWKL